MIVANGVYKIAGVSNVYYLKNENVIIDTGIKKERRKIRKELEKLVNINNIRKVILTHLHYDHIGNIEVFKKADFYAGKNAIKSLKDMPFETVLDFERVKAIEGMLERLKPAKDINGLKIIECPGHTYGSISVYYPKKQVLFSGDTLFYNGVGRTDLPTSEPDKMGKTLARLRRLRYKILCPGHDY
ncbi:MAG: MBL fold metallo-hydrolase [Candidatus Woesearchaeota archaeon]